MPDHDDQWTPVSTPKDDGGVPYEPDPTIDDPDRVAVREELRRRLAGLNPEEAQ